MDEIAVRKEILMKLIKMIRLASRDEYDELRTISEEIDQIYAILEDEGKIVAEDAKFIEMKDNIIAACEGNPDFPDPFLINKAMSKIAELTNFVNRSKIVEGLLKIAKTEEEGKKIDETLIADYEKELEQKRKESNIPQLKKKAVQILKQVFLIAGDDELDVKIRQRQMQPLLNEFTHTYKIIQPFCAKVLKQTDNFDLARNAIIQIPVDNTNFSRKEAMRYIAAAEEEANS